MSGDNLQLQHAQYQPGGARYPLRLVLHNIESPANVGSLFRLADALGIEKLYLSGNTPQPPSAKIRKTSRTTEQYVAYQYIKQPLVLIDELKAQGYTIVALELTTASVALHSLKLPADAKICLLPGSEKSGLDQALLDVADITVHIPMQGNNSSMNVAMACAIAAYSITRQLHGE